MCGICGIFDFNASNKLTSNHSQQASRAEVIGRMQKALERRGPDSAGQYIKGAIALGHRRLSIIDLSERSNQPLIDRALDLVLAFNGTIYNYRELRAELVAEGYQFFTVGDSEVILKAYAKWGRACVEKFNGMFAFAIWDNKKQYLFVARDRIGIKPLYYSLDNNHFVFASNSQAVLSEKTVNTDFDPVGLHMLFTLHAVTPAPVTLFKGLRKLPPACYMIIQANGQTEVKQYWHLRAERTNRFQSEWEWAEAIRESLIKAVSKRKLISDVPVGVLLSGGLDSSLLVGLLKEMGVEDLLTFSVGFEDTPEEKGNEFEYSDAVVDHFKTQHHKIRIANTQILARLPEVVDAMAEPIFGQDAIGFYLLAEQVSQQVKVVLSGQGADEVFGGYFWYPQMHAAQGDVVERFAPFYFDRDHEEFQYMMSSQYLSKDVTSEFVREQLTQSGAASYLDQVLRMDVTKLIVEDPVKRVDNMTMAWGLEARVPFLDHELIELAFEAPPELKMKNNGKHLLKMISRGLIPDAVIDRPKGYFPVPALKYVRGGFLEFMQDILLSRAAQERGVFNKDYVNKLLANPEKHITRIQGSKLWQIALFEFWLQRNLD